MTIALFPKALSNLSRTAVAAPRRHSYLYADLLFHSYRIASLMVATAPTGILRGQRICLGIAPSFEYVAVQWAIWRLGAIVVPLSLSHPPTELRYVMEDADCHLVVGNGTLPGLSHVSDSCNRKYLRVDTEMDPVELDKEVVSECSNLQDTERIAMSDAAQLIYTSGTTSRPKGVVATHGNLHAQINTMIDPWRWSHKDRILNVLPLHHVHGVVNALLTPLYAGATVEFEKFSPRQVWERISNFGDPQITVFMGVPTMYAKLLSDFDACPPDTQEVCAASLRRLRLTVSGSAALPTSLFRRWEAVSGHRLLERYGMTEIGMALSNPYEPQSARIEGTVGFPLPTVCVKIVDENMQCLYAADAVDAAAAVDAAVDAVDAVDADAAITKQPEMKHADRIAGQLLVKGPSVFSEYWHRPEETRRSFTADGYFVTGDMVSCEFEVPGGIEKGDDSARPAAQHLGRFSILGRASVDIIKRGGEKISALEIERVLMESGMLAECAVVGVDDETYGQRIVAVVVPQDSETCSAGKLKRFCADNVAKYKIPNEYRFVEEIPRNAMGKVNKKTLLSELNILAAACEDKDKDKDKNHPPVTNDTTRSEQVD